LEALDRLRTRLARGGSRRRFVSTV